MADWSDEKWLREGGYIKLDNPENGSITYYYVERVWHATYNYPWSATVAAGAESAEEVIENLKPIALDMIFQCLFGIKHTDLLIYLNLPTGDRVGGTPKVPKASSSNRKVGWFDYDKSPYHEPAWATEFFLQKGGNYESPTFVAFNNGPKTLKPELNFQENQVDLSEVSDADLVDKLNRRVIHYRPITLGALPSKRTGAG
jgi:hypothetical protein